MMNKIYKIEIKMVSALYAYRSQSNPLPLMDLENAMLSQEPYDSTHM